ncbi:unnamed protein product [Prunus brigantina]
MASDNTSFVQPAIPRLDGHYDHWSLLMENFLRSREYWSLVENGITEPAAETILTEAQRKALADQKLKDLKAKNFLFQAIDRVTLETILKKDTAKDIWDSLKQKYQGTARVKRAQLQALRREFEILTMKEGESVTDYFERALTIANKMRINGEQMEDVIIVEKILRSMTSKFAYVVMTTVVEIHPHGTVAEEAEVVEEVADVGEEVGMKTRQLNMKERGTSQMLNATVATNMVIINMNAQNLLERKNNKIMPNQKKYS